MLGGDLEEVDREGTRYDDGCPDIVDKAAGEGCKGFVFIPFLLYMHVRSRQLNDACCVLRMPFEYTYAQF
jgi:hypothetical protein